ncbi:MAG: sugar phosphate isomerase/epimerase [Bryobacteraceae bacterium]|nr:sugar phosphate isomerase/epimerase [Bryobacteraceae bacterium]
MISSRREALFAMAGAAVGAPRMLPLAICNETFAGMSFYETCTAARRIGYTGLEVDASTLGPDPVALTAAQRNAHRRMMEDAGLQFVGFHSFLKAPSGLHLTTPDAKIREKSWNYFADLIELCASLGPGPLMVLGSGKQRSGNGTAHLTEGLARMAAIAAKHGVTILLEPLSPQFTDNVNTLAQAKAIVQKIDSPNLRTMLDTHNLVAETESAAALLRGQGDLIRHIHLNEMDGRYPGSGTYPFAPLLQATRDSKYSGWLSVEVFDFKPDGETVARRSFDFIRQIERSLK